MKSDTLLFIIIIFLLLGISGFIIWQTNKGNDTPLISDDVKPFSNVTNDTMPVVNTFLKFKDFDDNSVVQADFRVFNNSVVKDENDTVIMVFRDELVWSDSVVGVNYEVFNESVINMTYEVIAWKAHNNFSNYYGSNVSCVIVQDDNECSLLLKKKGNVYVSNVSEPGKIVFNIIPEFWVRKPSFLVGYDKVFNARIEGLSDCSVPEQFVLDFDKCYYVNDFVQQNFSLLLRYDGFETGGVINFLFYDIDFVDETENVFVDDVPNTFLELNITE